MTRFILIDVEADMRGNGTPHSTRMLSFGCVDLQSGAEFEGILWPGEPWPEKPVLSHIPEGAEPFDRRKVFEKFEEWLGNWPGERIVGVSDNNGYDMMFFNVTWDQVMNSRSPLGHSSRRIADLWAGTQLVEKGKWKETQKWKRFRVTEHSHRAVEDARGNREALLTILKKFDVDPT